MLHDCFTSIYRFIIFSHHHFHLHFRLCLYTRLTTISTKAAPGVLCLILWNTYKMSGLTVQSWWSEPNSLGSRQSSFLQCSLIISFIHFITLSFFVNIYNILDFALFSYVHWSLISWCSTQIRSSMSQVHRPWYRLSGHRCLGSSLHSTNSSMLFLHNVTWDDLNTFLSAIWYESNYFPWRTKSAEDK